MSGFREVTIGDCRLIRGDAREIVPTLEYDSVATDPPFGMKFQSNFRIEQHEPIAGDENADLLCWACRIPTSHSAYVFARWDNVPDVPKPKSVVTWVKNNWSMGDLEHEHARQSESIFFYPGPDHFWPTKRPTDVVFADRTANENHPSEKPVDLMRQVLRWTRGVVLDPFMGSGTTGVACAKMERHFIGIEINDRYFDIACRRIEQAYADQGLYTGAMA